MLITFKKLIKFLFIYNDIYIIYNNFNYYQKTQYWVISKISKFNLYITKKNFREVYIPKGGLKQLILNNTRQLKLNKVVNIAKNKFNNLQKQISISFITNAI